MEATAGVYARDAPFLERAIQIGVIGNQLIGVEFPAEVPTDAETEHPILDTIERYLDGAGDDLADIEVAMTVDTETRRVLEAIREIPHGQERDVATLASLTPGIDPDDTDLVRTAIAENPTPLVIPDHRISDAPGAGPPDVVDRLRALEGLD